MRGLRARPESASGAGTTRTSSADFGELICGKKQRDPESTEMGERVGSDLPAMGERNERRGCSNGVGDGRSAGCFELLTGRDHGIGGGRISPSPRQRN